MIESLITFLFAALVAFIVFYVLGKFITGAPLQIIGLILGLLLLVYALKIFRPLLPALVAVLVLTGCLSTDTGNLSTDRRNAVANVLLNKAVGVLGQFAVASISAAANQESDGGKVDWQHTLADSAWKQAGSIVTAQDFKDVLAAATLNHVPQTVAAASRQLAVAQAAGVPTKDAAIAIADALSGHALASVK